MNERTKSKFKATHTMVGGETKFRVLYFYSHTKPKICRFLLDAVAYLCRIIIGIRFVRETYPKVVFEKILCAYSGYVYVYEW